MTDVMTFPETLDEFMEQYKIVDTEQVYTNGVELVPIFRIKQWRDAHRRKKSKWIVYYECPECGEITKDFAEYCPFCNADMREERTDDTNT